MNFSGLPLVYWCVLVAALLPIGSAGIAKWGTFLKPRREGGFDNHHPRTWLNEQTGFRARANAAQTNGFEQLPFFVGAVVAAQQMGGHPRLVALLALAYVVLRVGFVAAYLGDRASLRSVIWALALLVNIAILFAGVP